MILFCHHVSICVSYRFTYLDSNLMHDMAVFVFFHSFRFFIIFSIICESVIDLHLFGLWYVFFFKQTWGRTCKLHTRGHSWDLNPGPSFLHELATA